MRFAAALIAVCILAAPARAQEEDFGARLAAAALERTHHRVVYDSSYVAIAYPGGDVASDRGVCADVVIRALRAVGVDLQTLVHEDMQRHFSAYPAFWGLKAPDSNIDHRRVPNLETYFRRAGDAAPVTHDARDYRAGDIVAWNLRGDGGFLPHIGIVSDKPGASGALMVVHNIGMGPRLEDVLFNWKITGHYRLVAPSRTP
ncbi:MAG TPA: DUF1287 domain-containing protein [Parvularculaceae bacterium]|nr:DUF1287 domain-containing protein [Parvularculaceae bacterium]